MSVSRDRIRSAREDVLEPADTAVRLRIRNASVLGLSAVVYGLPLLAFVIGLVLGYFVLFPGLGPTYQPLGAFGVAVGFLALAGAVISRFDRQVQDRVSYEVEPMGSRAGSPTGGEGSTDLHSRMDPGQGASATDEMLTR
jgi:positive regulator of sigma E activity